MTELLGKIWHQVLPPFGSGTVIQAGAEDCSGHFVLDCESLLNNEDGGIDKIAAIELATHIVALHNNSLKAHSDNGQIAESVNVDFESNLWMFKMKEGFTAGYGKYMIVDLPPNA